MRRAAIGRKTSQQQGCTLQETPGGARWLGRSSAVLGRGRQRSNGRFVGIADQQQSPTRGLGSRPSYLPNCRMRRSAPIAHTRYSIRIVGGVACTSWPVGFSCSAGAALCVRGSRHGPFAARFSSPRLHDVDADAVSAMARSEQLLCTFGSKPQPGWSAVRTVAAVRIRERRVHCAAVHGAYRAVDVTGRYCSLSDAFGSIWRSSIGPHVLPAFFRVRRAHPIFAGSCRHGDFDGLPQANARNDCRGNDMTIPRRSFVAKA